VAESKRRGEDAVEEPLDDEVFDDAADDDALNDDEDATAAARRAGTAVQTKSKDKDNDGRNDGRSVRSADDHRPGLFGRIGRFIREIVAELRKVIWPTRKELLTYATVVVVFVAIMLTVVGLLDLGFAKAVLFVFGGGKK